MELKGREILSVGTWNDSTFTKDDLDGIVSSFNALGLKGRVPLKLGHDNDAPLKDGDPALGWVDRIWRQGNRLMADFAGIPKLLYDVVQDNMYKFVSVELLKGVKASTQVIPWVLDAVALLGATRPAVGILNDLQALTLARKPALLGGARLVFKREFSTPHEGKQMDKAEVEAMLREQAQTLTAKFSADLQAVRDDAAAKLAAEKADRAKVELSAHRAAINAQFETAIKADILEPKFREQFERVAGVKDDARVMGVKLEDVATFIKDNGKAPKKPKELPEKVSYAADGEENERDASKVLALRVNKLMFARDKKPTDFESRIQYAAEVLRADPALAEAYKVAGELPVAA